MDASFSNNMLVTIEFYNYIHLMYTNKIESRIINWEVLLLKHLLKKRKGISKADSYLSINISILRIILSIRTG